MTAAQEAEQTAGRRVVVTGIGAISSIGIGAEGLWSGVKCARSGIGPITHFDASSLPCRIAAEARDFDPTPYFDAKAQRRLGRPTQFAIACSKQALADAQLDMAQEDRERVGVCVGSALGGAAFAEEQHTMYLQEGIRGVNPHVALQVFVGASSCCVAIATGATGYSTSNADSCASGPIALGNAWSAIRRGEADVMLAGATDAPLAPLCFGAFALIRAMSTRNDDPGSACRPFDKGRDGFVMGEGAAILVLEEREHALKRGARIYAELAGFACTNDAFHMTAPRPDGTSASRCLSLAMQAGGIAPADVDYVNAHGSSTPLNDSTETLALKQALGEDVARKVPISATKSMHGHALGASGAIEAAICCLAMEHSWIPPTINYENPDPECDLDYVPNVGREKVLNTVLSNSFGFGGINAALVFTRR